MGILSEACIAHNILKDKTHYFYTTSRHPLPNTLPKGQEFDQVPCESQTQNTY